MIRILIEEAGYKPNLFSNVIMDISSNVFFSIKDLVLASELDYHLDLLPHINQGNIDLSNLKMVRFFTSRRTVRKSWISRNLTDANKLVFGRLI